MPRALDPVQRIAVVWRFELMPELAIRPGREVPQRHGPGARVVFVRNDRDAPTAAAPENERSGLPAVRECAGDAKPSILRSELVSAVRNAGAARTGHVELLGRGRQMRQRKRQRNRSDQPFFFDHHAAISPTMPRRNASTHTTKMTPVITVTHWPKPAR